jgi:hypothetical protein
LLNPSPSTYLPKKKGCRKKAARVYVMWEKVIKMLHQALSKRHLSLQLTDYIGNVKPSFLVHISQYPSPKKKKKE